MTYDNSVWDKDGLIPSYTIAAAEILANLKALDEKKADINSTVPRVLGIAQKHDPDHETSFDKESFSPPYNGCKWWLSRDWRGNLTARCVRKVAGSERVIYTTSKPDSMALEDISDIHASLPGFLLGLAREFPKCWSWWESLLGVKFKETAD